MVFSPLVLAEDVVTGSCVLTGQVTDNFGVPVEDAMVTVCYHGDTVHTGFTDEDGIYTVEGIMHCRCLKGISCKKIGYDTVKTIIPIDLWTVQNFVLVGI